MLEGQLQIPGTSVKRSSGFALDIGGSLLKVVYFLKKDEENEKNENEKVEVHMASYPLDDIQKVLEHLKSLLGPGLERKVTFCGLGCMAEKELLSKYNIEFTTTSEMDLFVKAFCYLSQAVPPSSLLQDKPGDALDFTYRQLDNMVSILRSVNPGAVPQELPERVGHQPRRPEFPCLLVILGSGGALIKVEENGSYSIVEGHNRTGKTFLSLASLLIGTSDFDEIMSLASQGTHKAIDGVTADYTSGSQDELYAKTMPAEGLFFAFGKALGKGTSDFRREDLARTLLVTTCCDLAQVVHLAARANNVQHIYLSGSFVSHQLVQYELTRFLQLRLLCNPQHGLSFEFLRNPGYYGALGALIVDNMGVDFSYGDAITSTYNLQFLGVLTT